LDGSKNMPLQRIGLLLLIALGAVSALGEELRVKRASAEAKARAAAILLTAATARDVAPLEAILKPPVLCGPRLWQRLKNSMPNDKNRVGTATLVFDVASGRDSWGIQALDMTSLSEDARKVIQAVIEVQPGKIPVESGVFRGTGVSLLADSLRRRFLEGRVVVTQASEEDLQYYWLMIPYDIEEPVLRMDTSAGSLILDVEQDGGIRWIDLLPDDVSQAERSRPSCASEAEPTALKLQKGSGITPPRATSRREPQASASVEDGATAVIAAIIGEEGVPRHICQMEGDEEWGPATIDAFREWRFEPATLDGKPVAVQFTLTMKFRRR
jgi:hypothetical protein